jgi:hypothetical protein
VSGWLRRRPRKRQSPRRRSPKRQSLNKSWEKGLMKSSMDDNQSWGISFFIFCFFELKFDSFTVSSSRNSVLYHSLALDTPVEESTEPSHPFHSPIASPRRKATEE